MALPLPKVVADTLPGGPLVTSMRGMNALADDMLSNKIKGVQADYAPLTTQADAASKLAYANLMGPQFLAKLMGNSDVVANSPQLQDPRTVQKLYQAGMGQGTGNALMNMPGHPAQNQNSLSNWLTDKIKGIIGGEQGQGGAPQQAPQPLQPQQQMPQYQPQPQQQPNALAQGPAPINQANMSPQDRNAMNTMQPGDSYVIQGNQPNPNALSGPPPQAPKTYAENAGTFKGTVAEGEEAGKLRAKDIQDLNDVVFNAETKQATLDDVNSMIASPEIRELRQVPLAGRHEMSFYAKYGTPAQQQLVGRLYAQMGNIVKDSSRDFAGQFRKGEQQLLQGMKPNDSDTIDSMTGKAESLSVMNKMLMERSRLTSQYMSQYHINKLQASEFADKKINGQAIRDQVHNTLNPKPTDEDINFMAQKYKKTPDEIRTMLKAKGVL